MSEISYRLWCGSVLVAPEIFLSDHVKDNDPS